MTTKATGPQSPGTDWGAIRQGEHFVQVYEDESALMRSLAGFSAHALGSGGSMIVIATAAHRSSLQARLRASGHDPDAGEPGRYLALDAADTLSRFMVGGMPDPARFAATLLPLIESARDAGRPVHAFGEMVALLWAQGDVEATLALERLWNAFCDAHRLTLYCAYPRIGATRGLGDSLARACALHGRVLAPA